VFTAGIYLEYASSANIYNNLFDLPNNGIPGDGGGGAPAIEISYEADTNSLIRILNNTMIFNQTNVAQSAAILWGTCGGCSGFTPFVWPANGILQILNNVGYSWDTNAGDQGTVIVIGVVTNGSAPPWTINYNDWHSQQGAANDQFFWWNNEGNGDIESGTNDLHGGLTAMQSVGLEANGKTNDPQFVSLAFGCTTSSFSNNYAIQSNSPCVAAGTNLSGLNLPGLNADINGNPRPSSGAWDIGAYQH
jgi:hypothetical protein